MERLVPALITVAVVLIAFLLMWLGWRARARAGAALSEPAAPLAGETLLELGRVFYVATSRADAPLERVQLPGLRYRGYGSLTVASDGVAIALPGEPVVTVPAAAIDGLGTAQTTIDKVVEADGLTVLRWRSGDAAVHSSFRIQAADERAALRAAVDAISPSPASTPHQEA